MLALGLTFIPTGLNKKENLNIELDRFRRSINLKFFWNFRDKDIYKKRSPISKLFKSTWDPPELLNKNNKIWSDFVSAMEDQVCGKINTPNCSRNDLLKWRELVNDPNFYITKADKGGKIVIWPKQEYKSEALRQLADSNTYQSLSQNHADAWIRKTDREIKLIYHELVATNSITLEDYENLLKIPHKIPPIYFLPKIHKSRNEVSGTFVGRPIISACASIWKPIDLLITFATKTLLPEIPGSIIDSTALLNAIEKLEKPNADTILFSADVTALYPSIPTNEGIDACVDYYSSNFHIIKKYHLQNNWLPPPNPTIFRKILTIILNRNIFHFQNCTYYRQLKGTAMGASISVFFANTFMYSRTRYLIDNPPRGLTMFKRYIDDIVGVYSGNIGEIESLFNNAIDEHIQLTFVKSKKELAALDILIYIHDGIFKTKLYTKPTDAPLYVHWRSAHPPHLKKSIPYSQCLRLRRVISDDTHFISTCIKLLRKFYQRGYPVHVIQAALRKIKLLDRKKLLEKRIKSSDDRLHCIITYASSKSTNARNIVKDFYRRLQNSPIVTERAPYLSKPPIPISNPIVTYKVNRSLGLMTGPRIKNKNT